MRNLMILLALAAAASVGVATPAPAQGAPQWRPASTQMPTMPTTAELQGDWQAQFGAWFGGMDRVTGVGPAGLRAAGNPRPGSPRAQVVRFLRGPVPVVVMTDRNGDDRADMVEYFRDGSLVAQVIDADYSGTANAIRFYDASGALIREDRL